MSNGQPPIHLVEEDDAEAQLYQRREMKQMLAHQVWTQASQATEARIIKEWERGEHPLDREYAWHKLKAFRQLIQELRALSDRQAPLS